MSYITNSSKAESPINGLCKLVSFLVDKLFLQQCSSWVSSLPTVVLNQHRIIYSFSFNGKKTPFFNMNAAFNLGSGCLFFFLFLPYLKGRLRMAIYKLIFLKPSFCMQLWREQRTIENRCAWSQMHVRESREKKNSDSLVFKKCVSFYTNTESMQWRNLGLFKAFSFPKIKIYTFVF